MPWLFQDDFYLDTLRIISIILQLLGFTAGLFGECTVDHPHATPQLPHLASLTIYNLRPRMWLFVLMATLITFLSVLMSELFVMAVYPLFVLLRRAALPLWGIVSYSDWSPSTPVDIAYILLAYFSVTGG